MSEAPWLTLIGFGEDGPDGLPAASRRALDAAEVVTGAERHLGRLPPGASERIVWPVPFADGLTMLAGLRGRRVAMLVSGDPFWHGAGSAIARLLGPGEWRALPAPSTFALAAARLGWPLEATACLGLHAAPLERLRPHLAPGARAIVLVRDGEAVARLAAWLTGLGFGPTAMHVMEALGGPRERVGRAQAAAFDRTNVRHPVAVGLEVAGGGAGMAWTSGRDDGLFEHDGQITKRPMRALTLSALAPRPGEVLWDVGAGAGSISIEWLLTHPATEAWAIEAAPERCARIRRNATALGADRLRVIEGAAPDAFGGLPRPNAVFVGGGLDTALLESIWAMLGVGTRIVANAVTLESEALLAVWQARAGGTLLRVALAEAAPLGAKRGWKAAHPVTQWSVTR